MQLTDLAKRASLMEEQELRNTHREILALRAMNYSLGRQLDEVQKSCGFEKLQNLKLGLKFDRLEKDEGLKAFGLTERSDREFQKWEEEARLELLCLKGEAAFLRLQINAFWEMYYSLRHENVKLQNVKLQLFNGGI